MSKGAKRKKEEKECSDLTRCRIHRNLFDRITNKELVHSSRQNERGLEIARDEYSLTAHELAVYMYYKSNVALFQNGKDRSVINRYNELYSIVYNEKCYGSCKETADNHSTVGISSFPKTNYHELLHLSLGRDENFLSANRCTSNSVGYKNRWYDSVRIRLIRNALGIGDESDSGFVYDYVKLLDDTYDNFEQVWKRFNDIYTWANSVNERIHFYPVRRSIWDLLVWKKYHTEDNSPFDVELISNTLIPDIGQREEFLLSIRILLRILYISCCLSKNITRTVDSSKRITKRNHDCWFPVKTSGVYFGLFATSVLPHELMCNDTLDLNEEYMKRWFKILDKIRSMARERYLLDSSSVFNNNDIDLSETVCHGK